MDTSHIHMDESGQRDAQWKKLTQKCHILWLYQCEPPRLGKFTETEFRLVVSKEGEEGREKLLNE